MNTTGTVLRSQVTEYRRTSTEYGTRFFVNAVRIGEKIVGLTGADALLVEMLGHDVLAIEEDPLPPTTKERWAKAIKAARKAGVAIRQNVSSCCRGCAEPFKTTKNFESETTPYAWTFGGQGMALRWAGNGERAVVSPDRYSYREVTDVAVFFNHGNGSAQRIVDAFRAEGFEVKWDGDQASCVEVTVPARTASRYGR